MTLFESLKADGDRTEYSLGDAQSFVHSHELARGMGRVEIDRDQRPWVWLLKRLNQKYNVQESQPSCETRLPNRSHLRRFQRVVLWSLD